MPRLSRYEINLACAEARDEAAVLLSGLHRSLPGSDLAGRYILACVIEHLMGTRDRDEDGRSSIPESGVNL